MKLEPITTLNIDKQIFVVSELPPNVRTLVTLLDSWRQEEADVRDKLTMLQAAQRTLTQEIVTTVQAVVAAAAPAPVVEPEAVPAAPSETPAN